MVDPLLNLMPALQDSYFVTFPSPWSGHIPFAYWIVHALKPDSIVELGTFRGNSYFNFCHAVQNFGLNTKAYAIDTWEGDEHGGFYGGHIYHEVEAYNRDHFPLFSKLIRSTFDQSLDKFDDSSIDLLHIDGFHTYEAVKNDFVKWLPKLSERGVVILHDTNVIKNNFGVWKFFEDLKRRYPCFWFNHCNGLGVVMVGKDIPDEVKALDAGLADNRLWVQAFTAFSRLGRLCEQEAESLGRIEALERKINEMPSTDELMGKIHCLEDEVTLKNRNLSVLNDSVEHNREGLKSLLDLLVGSVTVRNSLLPYRDKTKELTNMCRDRDCEISSRDGIINHLNNEIHHLNVRINTISRLVEEKDIQIAAIRSSSSWKLTRPLRGASIGTRKGITLSRLIAQGRFKDIRTLLSGHRQHHREVPLIECSPSLTVEGKTSVTIIVTDHTLFVAYILASSLTSLGFDVSVMTEMPETFSSRFYFVVCAQMFDRLPPADRRICVQLEQSSMSRWFNEKYVSCMKESLAVIEYSSVGLRFLDGLGVSYPKVFYARIGGIPDYLNYIKGYGIQIPATPKEYDVIFYGDINNIRRQRILEAVSARYKVKVINDLFGEELYREIAKARVCLNIHYYDESALESTRIFEVLSIGVPVVSETSPDISDYDFHCYGKSISFVEVGDVEGIITEIGQMLDQGVTVPLDANRQAGADFHFYVSRLMLAIGAIDFRRVYTQSRRMGISSPVVALSMPETYERREMLINRLPNEPVIFPGLRSTPGWVGAAYSFKFLAKKLLESGVEHALIFEDDAEFSGGMGPDEILDFALKVKKNRCEWDVFSAFISDLHCDTTVSAVFDVEGRECALLNRMVGMVCNVYSRKALELIAQWDEKNHDIETNTIDRYLEAFDDMRIVTTLPFLVGHSEMVSSSMWGVNNLYMKSMITSSSNLLFEKIWAFKANKTLRSYDVGEIPIKGVVSDI